ncbi:MAG: type II secretion system protein [Bdellovibrionales bacterium]
MTLRSLTRKDLSPVAGMSLTESAIVLAIVGLILSGLWSMIASVRAQAQQENMVSLMVEVVNNVRDAYKGMAGTAAGDLTSFLVGQSVFPPELIRRRTSPYTAGHVWDNDSNGGSLIVQASSKDSSAYFELVIGDLDQKKCVALAGMMSGDDGPKGFDSIQINSSAIETSAVSPEIAALQCLDSDNNRLVFSYRLRHTAH